MRQSLGLEVRISSLKLPKAKQKHGTNRATASEAVAGENADKYTKKPDTPMLLLANMQKREDIMAGCEAKLEERQQALRRREDEVEDWENTVWRREIEVEDKGRIINRMGTSLARKKKELKFLEKSVARRGEALRKKGA